MRNRSACVRPLNNNIDFCRKRILCRRRWSIGISLLNNNYNAAPIKKEFVAFAVAFPKGEWHKFYVFLLVKAMDTSVMY